MTIKNVILGIAIIILTISVAIFGINTFYPSPQYEDFCNEVRTAEYLTTPERCEKSGGKWFEVIYEGPKPIEGREGYCDRDFYCREEYHSARKNYSRNLFLITLPLGILIILLGTLLFNLESVGAGLMGGGVGIILRGVFNFWEFADDWLKFVLSLVGLGILIWLAYYVNKKFGNKKKKK